MLWSDHSEAAGSMASPHPPACVGLCGLAVIILEGLGGNPWTAQYSKRRDSTRFAFKAIVEANAACVLNFHWN